MLHFLTSPWFIVTVVVAFLISNFAAVKYLSNKNFKSYHQRNNDLDRLLDLDKKHKDDLKQKSEDDK